MRSCDLHLICTWQLLHSGMRTPGPAALFKMPRPRLGAEVAPKAPPLPPAPPGPPAPAESSTLELSSLRLGGKTAGAGADADAVGAVGVALGLAATKAFLVRLLLMLLLAWACTADVADVADAADAAVPL